MLQKSIIIYLVAINLIAYTMMWYDKSQAIKKQNRMSEKSLLFMAFILGAIGIYCGMKAPIYHKAAKLKFRIGIPVMIILNGISIYFMVTQL